MDTAVDAENRSFSGIKIRHESLLPWIVRPVKNRHYLMGKGTNHNPYQSNY